MRLTHLIPKSIRTCIKLLIRKINDRKNSYNKLFCSCCTTQINSTDYPQQISSTQKIKKSSQYKEKIHNLKIAINKLQGIAIHPGELFSFWRCVGKATKNNGYKKGRGLISNKVTEEYGGGLCQLSGILYLAVLRAGLKIVERHHHSIDIYTEEERFSALGSDATIVFAYKDFRFLNTSFQTLYLDFSINENELVCKLHSKNKIEQHTIEFKRTSHPNYEVVDTIAIINNNEQTIAVSKYHKLQSTNA